MLLNFDLIVILKITSKNVRTRVYNIPHFQNSILSTRFEIGKMNNNVCRVFTVGYVLLF